MEKPHWGNTNRGKAVEVNIRRMRTLSGLDAYGLRLANAGHVWTAKERRAFNKRVRDLSGK